MTVLVCGALVAACTATPDPGPSGPAGEGGVVAWSVETATGSHDAWIVRDTAVVLDGSALLGLSAADGSPRWRLPYPGDETTFTIAGGMVVVQRGHHGAVDVVAPDTGRIAWSVPSPVDVVARDDALYLDPCPDQGKPAACAVTKRRLADGATLWSVENPEFRLLDNVIGGRRPLAPAASAYLPVILAHGRDALLDTATGRLLPGRAKHQAWYAVAAGRTLVTTDHDPPPGDDDCTVAVTAVDGPTGKPAWTGKVYSGRRPDGECHKRLSDAWSGTVMFGSGSDVAAVNRSGRTTLTDFTTGTVRWTAQEPGVPIAADDRSLLVRDNAEDGPVALLDLATGRRLWTAPDPGLPVSSASWASAVAGDLVAVMGATGDRPYVLVFDARTGRQLARRGGWLTGLGTDWVMVSTSAGANRLRLETIRF
ncbi:hypothetical protein GCM10010168_30100 [Actinoplanes ianthinogenes]|uniref:Pyrrolo-quinoline quinone repeat domain-containing protein n=1 Tax=Actinoplanes ianthinogenes TaxID=122358 RepID=A0ABN6C6L2_9ACTN|nr:PQQ-binding-like beta-propeller repeat protein [Actinoplanes ianthinogenes]BCJ40152.1 hypothetical protein Aiant_08090 [Actinoplanes ianthinogenes]GGR10602.1 hypothetical protein GCM10010168_30100 [Actinoplanes ianthinogenes]